MELRSTIMNAKQIKGSNYCFFHFVRFNVVWNQKKIIKSTLEAFWPQFHSTLIIPTFCACRCNNFQILIVQPRPGVGLYAIIYGRLFLWVVVFFYHSSSKKRIFDKCDTFVSGWFNTFASFKRKISVSPKLKKSSFCKNRKWITINDVTASGGRGRWFCDAMTIALALRSVKMGQGAPKSFKIAWRYLWTTL